MIGKTISHYRIVNQLGAGGMGIVYAAEDERLGRSVALKFVPEDLAKDEQALKRLRGEARTASALSHASICTIYDIDEDDGRPFIVMELLKGQNLRERLAAKPLKIHEVVDIGIQVADALDWAHSRGVIHRDIKPTNLFLVDRGQVKIVDFGLAKQFTRHPASMSTGAATADLTSPGTTLGTVAYMSPEQVTGEELDGRTDIFSFGIVLYECVTGHQPFTGKTSGVIMAAILNKAPVAPLVFNPELPPRLQEVINNCLEKDRELRYQNAGDLRADLKRIRRDLESGHSQVMRSAGVLDAATSGGATSGDRPTTAATMESSQSRARTAAQPGARGASVRPAALGAIVMAIALAATSVYVLRRSPESTRAAADGSPEALIRSRLESAAASLRAKNYSAALAQSQELLQSAPNQAEAIRIRDEASTTIARFDEEVTKATALLAAGNPEAATTSIDAARSIDPAAPVVSELSARLISAFRSRAETARQTSSAAPAPAGSGLAERQAADDRARRESQQSPALRELSESMPQTSSGAAAPSVPGTPAAPANAGQSPVTSSPGTPSTSTGAQPVLPTPSPARAAASPPPASDASRASPPPASEDDDAAIRRVVTTYARAIETKDVSLFRTIKPNLSPQELRRIEDGFRAVSSQQVRITILAIDRRGQDASVRVRRTDTIDVGGRQQTSETQQTMTLMRNGPVWVIREIGR